MKLLGISLRRPNFAEITASAAIATGLWLAGLGAMDVMRLKVGAEEAGALLLLLVWGCLSVRFGIQIGDDRRHAIATVAVSAVLLALYKGALLLAG